MLYFILLHNSLSSASEAFDGTYQTNVVVTSAGTCTYIPPGIFKSSCQIGGINNTIRHLHYHGC